jgi:hypothetical protein
MSIAINPTLLRFVSGLTQAAMADIPEEAMNAQPAPGINPPLWILGHLAVVADSAIRLAGGHAICPAEWGATFGRNSTIDGIPPGIASRAQFQSIMARQIEILIDLIEKLTPEQLAKPHPAPIFRTELPTVGDLLGNLLFSHHMMHIGQLTVWRRLMGLPRIINI